MIMRYKLGIWLHIKIVWQILNNTYNDCRGSWNFLNNMKTKGPRNETQLPFSFTTHLDRVIDVFFLVSKFT